MVVVDLGFCPRCGGHLGPCEDEGNGGGKRKNTHRSCCSVCGFVVYHNPFPIVDATVVDGDRALFVKRARAPDRGCWSLPGGYLEVGERLDAGAARELREETGIEVSPSDLTFVGTGYAPLKGDQSIVELLFAAPVERATGHPVAGDDAAEVRFWTREEIAANPPELRAGDIQPILWAIDTLGDAAGPDGEPLW